MFGLAENPRLLQLSQPIQYRASQEYSQKIQPIVEFFKSLFPGEPDLKKMRQPLLITQFGIVLLTIKH